MAPALNAKGFLFAGFLPQNRGHLQVPGIYTPPLLQGCMGSRVQSNTRVLPLVRRLEIDDFGCCIARI